MQEYYEKTVQSEYANSPVILRLIENFNDCIDPSADIDEFYRKVWNIQTAEGYGLDVWGRIVGVSRVLPDPNAGGPYLGFSEAGDTNERGFGHGIFWGGKPATHNFALSDDAFRSLILVKALSNISDASTRTYNMMLMMLFPGRGNAFVSDTGGMSSRLTFYFLLKPFEITIIKQSGVFAPPSGVQFQIMSLIPSRTFGFSESGKVNVGSGWCTFFKGFR